MTISVIISIISLVFAIISISISAFMHYINTKHRMLDKNPFFIFNTSNFESEYHQEILVNDVFYNFINASLYKDELLDLRKKSNKEYKKRINISKDRTFLKLHNSGGVGKNLIVTTSMEVELNDLKERKKYKVKEWEVLFEGKNNNNLGDYSLLTRHQLGMNGERIFFNEKIEEEQKYKGITSEGSLNINIPKEFLLFFNLYMYEVVKNPPTLKITVKGKNIYNKNFEDTIILVVQGYEIREGQEGRYLNVNIKGV